MVAAAARFSMVILFSSREKAQKAQKNWNKAV